MWTFLSLYIYVIITMFLYMLPAGGVHLQSHVAGGENIGTSSSAVASQTESIRWREEERRGRYCQQFCYYSFESSKYVFNGSQ